MKNRLRLFFGIVLICMLLVTSWASLQEGVFVGGGKLLREPWGIATLADTYFAFFTFYLWVLYKEQSIFRRLLWLALIILLGNIAMAAFALIQVQKSKTDSFEGIFLRA